MVVSVRYVLWPFLPGFYWLVLIGVDNVNIFALPPRLTHSVNGFLPTCSFVTLAALVTAPQNVARIGVEHFVFAVFTVTPVILFQLSDS